MQFKTAEAEIWSAEIVEFLASVMMVGCLDRHDRASRFSRTSGCGLERCRAQHGRSRQVDLGRSRQAHRDCPRPFPATRHFHYSTRRRALLNRLSSSTRLPVLVVWNRVLRSSRLHIACCPCALAVHSKSWTSVVRPAERGANCCRCPQFSRK